jgi:hypothetical protein
MGFGAATHVHLRVPDAAAVVNTRLPCRVTRDGGPRHRRPPPTLPPRRQASWRIERGTTTFVS